MKRPYSRGAQGLIRGDGMWRGVMSASGAKTGVFAENNPIWRRDGTRKGPGSRNPRRALYAYGLRVGRGRVDAMDIQMALGAVGQHASSFRTGFVRGAQSRGRNLGSFKTRSGSWKKGKGGRFVGSGG